jgi:hypothetical protein
MGTSSEQMLDVLGIARGSPVTDVPEFFLRMQPIELSPETLPEPSATALDRLHASLLYCVAEARLAGAKLIVHLLEMAITEIESMPRNKPAF